VSRLLGVDLGERRIGLAVADTERGTVRALATMRRGSAASDAARIGRLIDEQKIEELVVGLPRNMDGTEGSQADATRAWAEELRLRLGVPVVWRDERLTSVAAETELGRPRRGRSGGPPSGVGRQQRRAAVDREAARLILEAEVRAREGIAG
jgi:putative Holliday junction resolvase